MKMEAEIWVMPPQAKESLKSPEMEEVRKNIPHNPYSTLILDW